MKKSVFRKDIAPFILWILLLLLFTYSLDFLLHRFQQAGIGKYLGIPGTIILLFSFTYSLRKRKVIQKGSPKLFLGLHQYLAWLAALLILIHAGIHFNALLPWAALTFMLIVFISGLTGKFILKRARETLKQRNLHLIDQGFSDEEIEKKIFLDVLAVQAMTQWRLIHKPITIVFAIVTTLHIITIFLFWSW